MSIGKISSPLDIAVSGLRAQSMRLKVISNNIASADAGQAEGGKPYRRQKVVLSTNDQALNGVKIGGIGIDTEMPKVQIPIEMMQMMAASRAYQANAAVLKRYQEGIDVTLELLK